MQIEHGFTAVHFDPTVSRENQNQYTDILNTVWEIDMKSRYLAMAQRPMACVLAVEAWKGLRRVFPEYELDNSAVIFDIDVVDAYGYDESGQVMLKMSPKKKYTPPLILDVAGYLFGFEYEGMFIGAGPNEFISKQVTEQYQTKYPGLNVTVYSRT